MLKGFNIYNTIFNTWTSPQACTQYENIHNKTGLVARTWSKGLILSRTFSLNLPVLDEHATGQLGLLVDALVHHYPEQPCKYYTKKHKPPFKPKIHLPGRLHPH